MTPEQLPATFCWTKVGLINGEDFATTVLRKEWERLSGGGRFLWEVNRPLGNHAHLTERNCGNLISVFSPASAKPKSVQKKPEDALLWNAWIDSGGQLRPLPSHVFLKSATHQSSGDRKKAHFALVCSSLQPLTIGSTLKVFPDLLRNVGSGKRLGAALSSVIVDQVASTNRREGRHHPVALIAKLESPFFVRLAQPTLVKLRDLAEVDNASRVGDFETYMTLVRRLRSRPLVKQARGFVGDLFDMPTPETRQTKMRHAGQRTNASIL